MRNYVQNPGEFRDQACKWQLLSLLLFHWLELSLIDPLNSSIFVFLSICENIVLFQFYLGYSWVLHCHVVLINFIYVFICLDWDSRDLLFPTVGDFPSPVKTYLEWSPHCKRQCLYLVLIKHFNSIIPTFSLRVSLGLTVLLKAKI